MQQQKQRDEIGRILNGEKTGADFPPGKSRKKSCNLFPPAPAGVHAWGLKDETPGEEGQVYRSLIYFLASWVREGGG